MIVEDENELDDLSRLVAVGGMTPEDFAKQTAVMSGIEAPSEDDMPGVMVMRRDYKSVRDVLASENEELALLTDANKSVADAMVALAHGARIFCRHHSVDRIQMGVVNATETALVFKVERAA